MSNIIKSKEELIILRDVIHYVDINNISKRYVEQTLKLLIPKIDNQSLIKYSIREKGYHTACFIPENNALLIVEKAINIKGEAPYPDFDNIFHSNIGVIESDFSIKGY